MSLKTFDEALTRAKALADSFKRKKIAMRHFKEFTSSRGPMKLELVGFKTIVAAQHYAEDTWGFWAGSLIWHDGDQVYVCDGYDPNTGTPIDLADIAGAVRVDETFAVTPRWRCRACGKVAIGPVEYYGCPDSADGKHDWQQTNLPKSALPVKAKQAVG